MFLTNDTEVNIFLGLRSPYIRLELDYRLKVNQICCTNI